MAATTKASWTFQCQQVVSALSRNSSFIFLLYTTMVFFFSMQMLTYLVSGHSQHGWTSILAAIFSDSQFVRFARSLDHAWPYGTPHKVNIPPVRIDPIYQKEQDRIDTIPVKELCGAFGLDPLSSNPRRLFFGSLVADEDWQMYQIQAVETYNMYHSIALVESNTTQFVTPRKMHYFGNTTHEQILRYGHMFGNETEVKIGYWMEDMPDVGELDRKHEQTNVVVEIWKEAGMTENDVGIIANIDEVIGRDFLRALRVCDFPELQPGQRSCHKPKLCLASLQFEGSPLCIKKELGFHPDVISGQCIAGIGDPAGRVTPLRYVNEKFGDRVPQYGLYDPNDYPKHVWDSGKFPLWTAGDIRRVQGCAKGLSNYKETPGQQDTAAFGVAYHLHNWYDDFEVLRSKYATYSLGSHKARYVKLSHVERDVDVMVRCARDLGNEINPTGRHYYYSNQEGTVPKALGGNRPIYFLNATYVNERHSILQHLVAQDEKEYGSAYPNGRGEREI